jgi:hypothetical protein
MDMSMFTNYRDSDGSEHYFSLAKLKSSLKWEICAFLVTNMSAVLYPFSTMSKGLETANFLIVGTTTTAVMLSDTVFSVIATAIFLRPVLQVIRITKGMVQSDRAERMQKTKKSTLAGEKNTLFWCSCTGIKK